MQNFHMKSESDSKHDDVRHSERPASPYQVTGSQDEHEYRPEVDPSVFAEPWMQDQLHAPDVSDSGPAVPLAEQVSEDQSVWYEPGLSARLAGETPLNALTWYRWYRDQVATTSNVVSWSATLAVVLAGGVFAILGTFATQSVYGTALVSVTVFGPTTEEIMKIALPLWLVEKRPWLYRNLGQILICALACGAAFAAVENVIYLNVYVPNAPAGLAAWRWTVCVLLHTGCSTIAGIGVARIWLKFQRQQRTPSLADGAPWIIAAIAVHGLYNGAVTVLEAGGLNF
jgi:hypothetical protein